MTDPKLRKEIIKLYLGGMSTNAIARRYGRAQSYIGSLLTRSGITLRTRAESMEIYFSVNGFPADKKYRPQVLKMRAEGKAVYAIAKETMINIKTIRNILKREEGRKI